MIFCLIVFNLFLIRAREKTPVDNSAATQQNGGQNTPRTPPKRVRFAHDAFNWEGCSSPLPNPPHEVRYRQQPRERPATRLPKTKRRSPGRELSGRQPRGRAATINPKKAGGGKRGRRSCSIPRSKAISRCSNATEGRGKIDPFSPSLEPGFLSPF